MARISSGVTCSSRARTKSASTPSRAYSITFSRTKPVRHARCLQDGVGNALGCADALVSVDVADLLERELRLREREVCGLDVGFVRIVSVVCEGVERDELPACEAADLDREAPLGDVHHGAFRQVLRGLDLLKRADLLGWHFACSLR